MYDKFIQCASYGRNEKGHLRRHGLPNTVSPSIDGAVELPSEEVQYKVHGAYTNERTITAFIWNAHEHVEKLTSKRLTKRLVVVPVDVGLEHDEQRGSGCDGR